MYASTRKRRGGLGSVSEEEHAALGQQTELLDNVAVCSLGLGLSG